jgi:zinc transport system substrate-binding protein
LKFAKNRLLLSSFALLAALLLCSVSPAGSPALAADTPIKVFVSIQPQVDFVKRIGGEHVQVTVMVLPGRSPAVYEPSPRQMVELARARVYFRIGVQFEDAFIPRIIGSSNNLMIVDTRHGIQLRKMASHPGGKSEHSRGQTHNDDHGGFDPHLWLSPVLVKQQSKIIYDTLVRIDPKSAAEYTANYQSFIRDLDALDQRIRKTLAPFKGGKIFVFHPAYGYFADAYGLEQVAVEIEGRVPTGKALTKFIQMARHENAKVIFVQPQFSEKSAATIARAISGAVVPLDPLAGDYIGNMTDMAIKIETALKHNNSSTE